MKTEMICVSAIILVAMTFIFSLKACDVSSVSDETIEESGTFDYQQLKQAHTKMTAGILDYTIENFEEGANFFELADEGLKKYQDRHPQYLEYNAEISNVWDQVFGVQKTGDDLNMARTSFPGNSQISNEADSEVSPEDWFADSELNDTQIEFLLDFYELISFAGDDDIQDHFSAFESRVTKSLSEDEAHPVLVFAYTHLANFSMLREGGDYIRTLYLLYGENDNAESSGHSKGRVAAGGMLADGESTDPPRWELYYSSYEAFMAVMEYGYSFAVGGATSGAAICGPYCASVGFVGGFVLGASIGGPYSKHQAMQDFNRDMNTWCGNSANMAHPEYPAYCI